MDRLILKLESVCDLFPHSGASSRNFQAQAVLEKSVNGVGQVAQLACCCDKIGNLSYLKDTLLMFVSDQGIASPHPLPPPPSLWG